jgi:two-component system uhpT operon response regulator UhpA
MEILEFTAVEGVTYPYARLERNSESMSGKIRVAILDDHAATAEGYRARLSAEPDFEVVQVLHYGEELEPFLRRFPVDVLLLDIEVKASPDNPAQYSTVYLVPRLLDNYPDLSVLVISMHGGRAMIETVMDAGAGGYLLKDDLQSFQELPSILRTIVAGGMHLSPLANKRWRKRRTGELREMALSRSQLEALTLCAAYPNARLPELADKMHVANSTIRVTLSGAYGKLGVNTRQAAVTKAREMGILPPDGSQMDR